MTNFLFVYHGGSHPESPEQVAEVMTAWQNWFENMGDAVIDGGNPVGMSSTVLANGNVEQNGGSNPASGYSIVKAENQQAAEALAKQCPILAAGGSVEIAPIIEM